MSNTNDMLIDMSIKEDKMYSGKQVKRILERFIIQQSIVKSNKLKKLENEKIQLRELIINLLNKSSNNEPEPSTK